MEKPVRNKPSLKKRLKTKFEDLALKVGEKLHHKSIGLRYEIFVESYKQREDDVYVLTFPHSGSAVLRVMLYNLTSDGESTFKNVKEISPDLTEAIATGNPPEQLASPRILYSVSAYSQFPEQVKGKIIFLVRNGMDRAAAGYLFEKNEVNDTLTWEAYLQREFMANEYNWFVHTREWLENANRHPMLVIAYEDMLQSPEQTITRISKFLDIDPSEEHIARAKQSVQYDYILENTSLYDESLNPFKVFDQFIRKGKTDKGKVYFTDEQKEVFHKQYKKHLSKYKLKNAPAR